MEKTGHILTMLNTVDLYPHAGMTTVCHQSQRCTELQGK